jgi:pyrroloquinoline quinone (PQQ) biosynthesis protein C
MIKLVAEAVGLSRLLVRVKLLPLYLALIRSYKNTPSNNSLIVTKATMHALEVGCTKVTNT